MALKPITQAVPPVALRRAPSLGDVRIHDTTPNLDLQILIDAIRKPGVVPNPNASPGCSPILRAYLDQIGLAYGVSKELANDAAAHQTGDAVDIVPASTARNYLAALEAFQPILTAFPDLFTRIAFNDTDYPALSVRYGPIDTPLWNSATTFIHVESTKTRMLAALTAPAATRTNLIQLLEQQAPFSVRNVHTVDSDTYRRPADPTSSTRPPMNSW